MQESLELAALTDTGGFTYNSTQPYIYYIICLLLTKNIDSGKKKLSDSEKEMGSQLGAGENEIINNKIQLFNTEADLTTQLSDLQKSQSSMDGAIKSLQSAYDGATQLQSAIDGLQKAKDGVSQAKSGAKQLYRD